MDTHVPEQRLQLPGPRNAVGLRRPGERVQPGRERGRAHRDDVAFRHRGHRLDRQQQLSGDPRVRRNAGRPSREVPGRPGIARDPLRRGPGHRRSHSRIPRPRAEAPRFPQSDVDGVDHRWNPDAQTALGPRADRRVSDDCDRADGRVFAARGRWRLSADHHVGRNVRGRDRALARRTPRAVG